MNMTARFILPLSLALVAAGPVGAAQMRMTFTATGIVPDTDWSEPTPPTNPVSGEVVWDGFGFLSNANGLISIDLTIDGHTYAPEEVSLWVDPSGFVLAANVNGFNAAVNGTNDSIFGYEPGNPEAPLFLYATFQHNGY